MKLSCSIARLFAHLRFDLRVPLKICLTEVEDAHAGGSHR
jgi:hypothetical protein